MNEWRVNIKVFKSFHVIFLYFEEPIMPHFHGGHVFYGFLESGIIFMQGCQCIVKVIVGPPIDSDGYTTFDNRRIKAWDIVPDSIRRIDRMKKPY